MSEVTQAGTEEQRLLGEEAQAETLSSKVTFEGHDGIELVADAWGSPDAPPVLLLHGGGQTRNAWSGTAAHLAAAGWYAVSMDLRGHGESAWCPRGDYRHATFAADTTLVARSFSQRPVLVGASLGGLSSLFALGHAAEHGHPPLARGLILVDIATRMEMDGARRIMEFMQQAPNGFATLDEAAEAIASYNPHRPRPKDPRGLTKNLRLHDDGRYRWHWDPAFIEGRLESDDNRNDLDRLDDAARSIDIPTLLVRGKLSDLLSEEGAQHFLELVPRAQYVDVSDAGHMVAGDRNDKFTEAVLGFLRDHVE
jgi:pimeloyl-ACP methyl ester carboxylesterase